MLTILQLSVIVTEVHGMIAGHEIVDPETMLGANGGQS